jgi:hypothetical protein
MSDLNAPTQAFNSSVDKNRSLVLLKLLNRTEADLWDDYNRTRFTLRQGAKILKFLSA